MPSGIRHLQRGSGFLLVQFKSDRNRGSLLQIQHGFLDFRKAFRLSTTLSLKRPPIFNSLEEIGKMARHRNYRNYAYEDGTGNVP